MNRESAILNIDDHLAYMAGRKLINEHQRRRLVESLETLADGMEQRAEGKEQREVVDKLMKTRHALQSLAATTPKFTELVESYDPRFLENFAELMRRCERLNNAPLYQKIELMIMNERQTRLLAATDIATLHQYRTWKTMRVSELTTVLRKLHPELSRWFTEIDTTGTFDEDKAREESYERNVKTNH